MLHPPFSLDEMKGGCIPIFIRYHLYVLNILVYLSMQIHEVNSLFFKLPL